MRIYPLAPGAWTSPDGCPLPGPTLAVHATPHREVRAELHALGGPTAIMDAAQVTPDSADADPDDWSGGFDIHLGVHTRD